MIRIDKSVAETFPTLKVMDAAIYVLSISESNPALAKLKLDLESEIRSKYTLETVKDAPLIRSYRNFFWSVGIDPTKTRPASEALIRRILAGKPIPAINSFVDAYNIASAKSGVPIAAFDADRISGTIEMRFAKKDEKFLGIGMQKEMVLTGKEIVLEDELGLIAVYPYRDAERTKVVMNSRNVVLLFCGVPNVDDKSLPFFSAQENSEPLDEILPLFI